MMVLVIEVIITINKKYYYKRSTSMRFRGKDTCQKSMKVFFQRRTYTTSLTGKFLRKTLGPTTKT